MFCRNPKQQAIIENLEKTVQQLQLDLNQLKTEKEKEESILKIGKYLLAYLLMYYDI